MIYCINLAISCANVSIPHNGSVNSTDNILGTVVYFTCDGGYSLIGNNSIVCQKSGLWSGIFPFCVRINIDCGDPGTVKYGVKFYTNTTFGSLISFKCLTGYMLVGPSSIQCNSDGRWSNTLPQCLPIDCGDPGRPVFGRRELSNTTYQSSVNYTCFNTSYRLVGSAIRRCLSNGSWSGVLPNCMLIDCQSPELTLFGTADYPNGTAAGSLVTYICQEGYRLIGVAQRICLDNGSWSGVAPSCNVITKCSRPNVPVFAVTLYNNYTVGSTVKYDCIGGYKLIGPNMRKCLLNGTWSGKVPFCKPLDCSDPGTPRNGSRILDGTRYGSTVKYNCSDGHILIGSSIRDCLQNELWSGVAPECKLVECGSPETPNPAGVVFYSNSTAGSTITYSCLEGFKLVGEAERVCLNNGSWSGDTPSCVAITGCGFPDVPLLGLADTEDITVGSVTMYSCEEGYMILGNVNRTCLSNGEWSGETPVCVSV